MNKSHFSKVIIIIMSYYILGIVFSGCCLRTNYFRITGIQHIEAVEKSEPGNYNYNTIDTATTAFQFIAYWEREFLEYGNYHLNLIESTYATSCEEKVVNPPNPESLVLTVDKPFYFDSDTIYPQTPIQDFTGLNNAMDEYSFYISFQNEFLDLAVFDTGQYVFTIQLTTYDTIPETFTADLSLYMDIH